MSASPVSGSSAPSGIKTKPKPKPKPAKIPVNGKPGPAVKGAAKPKKGPKPAKKPLNGKAAKGVSKPKKGPKPARKPVNGKPGAATKRPRKPKSGPKAASGKTGKNTAGTNTVKNTKPASQRAKTKVRGKKASKSKKKQDAPLPKLPVHKYVGHMERVKHEKSREGYDLKPHHLSFLAQGRKVHVNGKIYYPKPEFIKNSESQVHGSHPIVTGYSSSEESDQEEDADGEDYSEDASLSGEADGVEYDESAEEVNEVDDEESDGEADGSEYEGSDGEEYSEEIEDPEALSHMSSEAAGKSPFGSDSVVSLASTESEERQNNSRPVNESTNGKPISNMKGKSETEEVSGEVYSFELDTTGAPVKNLVEKPESLPKNPTSHSPPSDESQLSQPPQTKSTLQPDSKESQNTPNSGLVSDSKSVIPPQIVDFEVCDADFEKHLQERYGSPGPASENGSKATGKRVGGEFDSSLRKRQRMERFGSDNNSSSSPCPVPVNFHRNKEFVGTSKALEKSFLRLTSEPIPANVRPQEVLEDCLPFVLKRFYSEKLSYVYINDQLKAIRQDLTIQHKKNQFTMRVYQTHARIAIEHNDLGEFNQCLSQLFTLYEIDRAKYELPEFVVYKVLYMIITGNNPEINKLRLRFLGSDAEKMYSNNHYSKWIKPALDLSSAIITGDYFSIFNLYRQFTDAQVPLASLLIKRNIIPKQRFIAFATMGKAFKRLSLAYLEEQLALNADGINTNEFLILHNLHMFIDGNDLDLAQAKPRILGLLEQGVFKRIDIKGQV